MLLNVLQLLLSIPQRLSHVTNYFSMQDLQNLLSLKQQFFPSKLLSISAEHQEFINYAN